MTLSRSPMCSSSSSLTGAVAEDGRAHPRLLKRCHGTMTPMAEPEHLPKFLQDRDPKDGLVQLWRWSGTIIALLIIGLIALVMQCAPSEEERMDDAVNCLIYPDAC
jgi:hypothetical protein